MGNIRSRDISDFGLSGAVAAPIVGRLADSYSERKIVYMGLVMQTISFIALLVGGSHLAILLLAIILLDVGNQFGQVANQTRVQGLGEQQATEIILYLPVVLVNFFLEENV